MAIASQPSTGPSATVIAASFQRRRERLTALCPVDRAIGKREREAVAHSMRTISASRPTGPSQGLFSPSCMSESYPGTVASKLWGAPALVENYVKARVCESANSAGVVSDEHGRADRGTSSACRASRHRRGAETEILRNLMAGVFVVVNTRSRCMRGKVAI